MHFWINIFLFWIQAMFHRNKSYFGKVLGQVYEKLQKPLILFRRDSGKGFTPRKAGSKTVDLFIISNNAWKKYFIQS